MYRVLRFRISNQGATPILTIRLEIHTFFNYEKTFQENYFQNEATPEIVSPSTESIDSGINISSHLSEPTSKNMNLSTLTEDAVQIYQRYDIFPCL